MGVSVCPSLRQSARPPSLRRAFFRLSNFYQPKNGMINCTTYLKDSFLSFFPILSFFVSSSSFSFFLSFFHSFFLSFFRPFFSFFAFVFFFSFNIYTLVPHASLAYKNPPVPTNAVRSFAHYNVVYAYRIASICLLFRYLIIQREKKICASKDMY